MHHEYTKSSHLYLRSVRTSLVARKQTSQPLRQVQIAALESQADEARSEEKKKVGELMPHPKPLWTENLEMTERSKEIVDAIIKERQIAIAGVTFLISRFAGENMVVPASPEAVEVWREEIVTEAVKRLSEIEMREVSNAG